MNRCRWMYIVTLLCAGTACSGEPDDTEEVTQVGGYYTRVGAVGMLGVLEYSDGSLLGYLCGQGDSIDQTRWLSGEDGVLRGADWSAAIFDGEVEVIGPSQAFVSDLSPLGEGGIYDALPNDCRTGLLVFPDGEEWSSVGTYCDGATSFIQVEPVGTIVAPDAMLSVRVQTQQETLVFDVTRLP
ncbi:MAG: hypothetical protein AB8H79_25560 [Myxococcota bacterium]